MQTGLVIETGEAREVHHFCVLAGYGAEAVNPYLAFETLEQLRVAERPAADRLRGAQELHQGDRQGRAEGDVQDGHLHLPVLLRRPDLRRRRPVLGADREVLHRHRDDHRGRRPAGDRRGGRASPPRRLWRQPDLQDDARRRRPVRLAPARRGARLDAGDRSRQLQHAVRGNLPDEYKAFAAASTSRASGC